MVLYEISSNIILVKPLRNKTSEEMVTAYQKLVDRLKEGGIEPNLHILDNEISTEYKDAIAENQMKFRLVPPHDHRRNIAEKAIQVFKDHFISVLCGTDSTFPVRLWCQILRQAEHQLNILPTSRVTPSMSAFEFLKRKHGFNSRPFCLLGCAVEMHVIPSKRKAWGEHMMSGFYIGQSWDYYRCHEVCIKETKT